jgi:hypothetical protein
VEEDWEALFAASLFPFAGLRNETIDKVLVYVRHKWPVEELAGDIVAEVKQSIPAFLESWERHPVFVPHMEILRCAARHIDQNDPISAVGLLLPRIEGLLRTHHLALGRTDQPKQSNLADSAVASIPHHASLLLPQRFSEYLQRVFFANFDSKSPPCDSNISISRHSVAHGVAPPAGLTLIQAAIGFLVLHQLFYCFIDRP